MGSHCNGHWKIPDIYKTSCNVSIILWEFVPKQNSTPRRYVANKSLRTWMINMGTSDFKDIYRLLCIWKLKHRMKLRYCLLSSVQPVRLFSSTPDLLSQLVIIISYLEIISKKYNNLFISLNGNISYISEPNPAFLGRSQHKSICNKPPYPQFFVFLINIWGHIWQEA